MNPIHVEGCLFCHTREPHFASESHVIPESAANERVVIRPGVVCDRCNNYFSQKLENHFCHYYPGALRKVLAVEETKKGKPPAVIRNRGALRRVDSASEGSRHLTLQVEQSVVVDAETAAFSIEFDAGGVHFRTRIGIGAEQDTSVLSRCLAKMTLETIYLAHGARAFEATYDTVRTYARRGGAYRPYSWCEGRWEDAGVTLCSITDPKVPGQAEMAVAWLPGAAFAFAPLPDGEQFLDLTFRGETMSIEGSARRVPLNPIPIDVTFGPLPPAGESPA